MLAKEITSPQHPIIKKAIKLRLQSKFRHTENKILLSGFKLLSEVREIETVFLKKGTHFEGKATEHVFVSKEILKKITGMVNPEPIAGIAPMPAPQSLTDKDWIVVLDQVSDPGNAGTIIRTAYALGWEGVFLHGNCVDLFNEKTLRASMGASLSFPYMAGDFEKLKQLSTNHNVFVADANGTPFSSLKPLQRSILILGNESLGVCDKMKGKFPALSIPIDKMDSLNVAAAGAILLYGLKNG